MLNVATPDTFIAPVPNVLLPSLKVTVPVGVAGPLLVVTVAVNVTCEPATKEFPEDESAIAVVAC